MYSIQRLHTSIHTETDTQTYIQRQMHIIPWMCEITFETWADTLSGLDEVCMDIDGINGIVHIHYSNCFMHR